MTKEQYKHQYLDLTNQIEELKQQQENLEMTFAREEAERFNVKVGDTLTHRGNNVYISSIFIKFAEARASLYFIKKDGTQGRKPYNSWGIKLEDLIDYLPNTAEKGLLDE